MELSPTTAIPRAMPSSLPSVAAYLRELPRGLDSYPDVALKGSVLLSLRNHPAFLDLAGRGDLPVSVARLVTEPPTATTWVPEVYFNVLMAGFYDLVFREVGGLPAYEAWVGEQNFKLMRTPLYRMLFAFQGPERLMRAAATRWSAFRIGTTLAVTRTDATSADLRLVYPPNLQPASALHAFSGAFRAAMRVARVHVETLTFEAERGVMARWHVEWSDFDRSSEPLIPMAPPTPEA
jgi:hypothetical protein